MYPESAHLDGAEYGRSTFPLCLPIFVLVFNLATPNSLRSHRQHHPHHPPNIFLNIHCSSSCSTLLLVCSTILSFPSLHFTFNTTSLNPLRWHHQRHPCRIYFSTFRTHVIILQSFWLDSCSLMLLPRRQRSKFDFTFSVTRNALTNSGVPYHSILELACCTLFVLRHSLREI